ncbi:MAG: type III secretion system translocon subunit SctE [Yersinia sp. (in: enterobacteria)]
MKMNSIPTDSLSFANDELYGVIPKPQAQAVSLASGALSSRLNNNVKTSFGDDSYSQKTIVAPGQAEKALQRLLSTGSEGMHQPTLRDVMQMDPMVLSVMMTQLVLDLSSSNASSICKQLERATEVQSELRNKQVEKYQAQINDSVAQSDQARKAAIVNVIFSWIIAAVETVVGVLKIMEGLVTGNPLAVASGAAYLTAGVAGMVKAGAETALLLGADKETCNDIIKVAGTVQSASEGVALVLDVVQIGRGIRAAGELTKEAVTKAVKEGVGHSSKVYTTRGLSGGVNRIAEGAVGIETAELQQNIDRLVVMQSFIDFMQNCIEDHKKIQQKQLREAYQQGADVIRRASEVIDNYGTALANIAGARA